MSPLQMAMEAAGIANEVADRALEAFGNAVASGAPEEICKSLLEASNQAADAATAACDAVEAIARN